MRSLLRKLKVVVSEFIEVLRFNILFIIIVLFFLNKDFIVKSYIGKFLGCVNVFSNINNIMNVKKRLVVFF